MLFQIEMVFFHGTVEMYKEPLCCSFHMFVMTRNSSKKRFEKPNLYNSNSV